MADEYSYVEICTNLMFASTSFHSRFDGQFSDDHLISMKWPANFLRNCGLWALLTDFLEVYARE